MATAVEIVQPSADRVAPYEASFLETSPWQIMTFDPENRYKLNISQQVFNHYGVRFPPIVATTHNVRLWNYRNKIEY